MTIEEKIAQSNMAIRRKQNGRHSTLLGILSKYISTEIDSKNKYKSKNKNKKNIKLTKKLSKSKENDSIYKTQLNKVNKTDTEGLNAELNELNEKIQKIENEIKELNKCKNDHQNCDKIKSTLQSKINVLSNEIEFENKRLGMLTEEPIKKDKTKIKMTSKSQQYAKSLRINALGNVEEKYNSKNNYKQLLYDFK